MAVTVAVAVLLMVWVIHLVGDDANEEERPTNPAMTVTATAARTVNWNEEFSASGSIEAWQEAIVGSQSTGLRLAEVKVDVGDAVKRGQLLARFDSAMLRAEEGQLAATLAQAKATLRPTLISNAH